MYLPFVMFAYAAALAFVLVGCALIGHVIPGLRGIRELAWAVVMGIAAVALIGARPWAPAFFTILLGNAALLACFLLLFWTTIRVLECRSRFLPYAVALCIADLPMIGYATWIHPDIVVRIWLSSGMLAIIATATAVYLIRHATDCLRTSALALAGLHVGTATVNVMRCVLSTIYRPHDLIHGDLIQAGFTYGQLIFCVGTCFGVLWLSLCRNRAELEQMALIDSLTGLLNRRAFDSILQREMQTAQAAGFRLGLILLDLDRFKEINDTYGHSAGDEVLRRISAKLSQVTRTADSLARYGGEEFVLLVRNARLDEVQNLAERMRAVIQQSSAVPFDVPLTASLGIAVSEMHESASSLLDRCDHALYAAKRAGRNTVWIGNLDGSCASNPVTGAGTMPRSESTSENLQSPPPGSNPPDR